MQLPFVLHPFKQLARMQTAGQQKKQTLSQFRKYTVTVTIALDSIQALQF
jgi:hypothetical protein